MYSAIKQNCELRKWTLWVANVRTNHVHIVVTAPLAPTRVMNAFKANATRRLRETGLWNSEHSPWAYGGSKRYLWNDEELAGAIAYVKYGQ